MTDEDADNVKKLMAMVRAAEADGGPVCTACCRELAAEEVREVVDKNGDVYGPYCAACAKPVLSGRVDLFDFLVAVFDNHPGPEPGAEVLEATLRWARQAD